MSDKTNKATSVITFAERRTCTYGMDLTHTDPVTEYEDLELELNPDPTPHDDWQDKDPCTQRCWKSHRHAQRHNED